MSLGFVKLVTIYVQKRFPSEEYKTAIKPMVELALTLSQQVGADPVVCVTASLLHRVAHGVTGPHRANLVTPILRESGFNGEMINRINECIFTLLPDCLGKRGSVEERVVADAYLLTYRGEIHPSESMFELQESKILFLGLS